MIFLFIFMRTKVSFNVDETRQSFHINVHCIEHITKSPCNNNQSYLFLLNENVQIWSSFHHMLVFVDLEYIIFHDTQYQCVVHSWTKIIMRGC